MAMRAGSAPASGDEGGRFENPALSGGRVLLTGVTGFLGAHLLYELLTQSDVTVSCLARAENAELGKQSLLRRLSWYFPEADWASHERRVSVVVGDVGRPQLGLPERVYDELADTHESVLNAAANVSHAGSSAEFFRVNTEGVGWLIAFARHRLKKQLHHVSTISVMGEFPDKAPMTAFDETHLEEGQTFRDAYDESKQRAEVVMRCAFAEGLAGAVYRVGYIAPHGVTGRFQQNIHQNYVSLYLRACVLLGFAPYLPHRKIQPTPVDSVARGILALMRGAKTRARTYYIQTPHSVSHYDIMRVLHAAGYPIRLMSMQQFIDKAHHLSRDEELLAAMPGIEARTVPIDSSWSQRELRRVGFEYVPATSVWLGKFIRHAIEVGFLEAPRFWNAAPLLDDLLSGPT
jgi:thioester reductase-like protein